MKRRTQSNGEHGKLSFERLENRELMAGVVANVSNGVLNVEGTNAADTVVVQTMNGTTKVWANSKVIFSTGNSSYSSIKTNLKDGRDNLQILVGEKQNLNRLDVNMGNGANEYARIIVGNAKTLNVDARSSVATKVVLNNSAIDNAFVDFGSDGGNDTLRVGGLSVGTLGANMGGGSDLFEVRSSSIRRAAVDMGSGSDRFDFVSGDAQIANGYVNGGADSDRFRNFGGGSVGGAAVQGFES